MIRLVHHSGYRLEWPGHVFPIDKYERVRERLVAEGDVPPEAFWSPSPASDETLALVHPPSYLARLEHLTRDPVRGYLEFEVPTSRAVLDAFRRMVGGTVLAAEGAARSGAAVNLGGGFHHAFADRGEGFCLLNDVAVAVRSLQDRRIARRFAILDCDLHQGNGTARIFADDAEVFTFSIHQERLYPAKERSDLDIGLDEGAGDEVYLAQLDAALPRILDGHRPDLAFYLAGADPYEDDQLGDLRLTRAGLRERDRRIFDAVGERGIPVVAVLAGGYARRTEDVVDIHVAMVREAIARFGPAERAAG